MASSIFGTLSGELQQVSFNSSSSTCGSCSAAGGAKKEDEFSNYYAITGYNANNPVILTSAYLISIEKKRIILLDAEMLYSPASTNSCCCWSVKKNGAAKSSKQRGGDDYCLTNGTILGEDQIVCIVILGFVLFQEDQGLERQRCCCYSGATRSTNSAVPFLDAERFIKIRYSLENRKYVKENFDNMAIYRQRIIICRCWFHRQESWSDLLVVLVKLLQHFHSRTVLTRMVQGFQIAPRKQATIRHTCVDYPISHIENLSVSPSWCIDNLALVTKKNKKGDDEETAGGQYCHLTTTAEDTWSNSTTQLSNFGWLLCLFFLLGMATTLSAVAVWRVQVLLLLPDEDTPSNTAGCA